MFTKKKKSLFDRFPILNSITEEKFPKHIFIIPDGNGRWAKEHMLPIVEGHRRGADVTEKILRDLSELKEVKIVTLWGFSADNWKRSTTEVQSLMSLMEYKITKTLDEVKRTGRKFLHIGRKDRLPKNLLRILIQAEEETKTSNGQIICLAIDFSGEEQELRLIEKARHLDVGLKVTQDVLWNLRDGSGIIRSADLLIRTASEKRTSDVGWLNGISTELYFIGALYPDISTEDVINGIVDFSKRNRRFGGRI